MLERCISISQKAGDALISLLQLFFVTWKLIYNDATYRWNFAADNSSAAELPKMQHYSHALVQDNSQGCKDEQANRGNACISCLMPSGEVTQCEHWIGGCCQRHQRLCLWTAAVWKGSGHSFTITYNSYCSQNKIHFSTVVQASHYTLTSGTLTPKICACAEMAAWADVDVWTQNIVRLTMDFPT